MQSSGDLIGRNIDGYEITALIGQGGLARVYRARQVSMDRDVAFKVLKDDLASDADMIARFRQNARALAQFEHPHILPLFAFHEGEPFDYQVQALMAGGTLADRIRRSGRIAVEDACRILYPIADALDYTHRHGFLHRNLKPQAILFDDSGNPYLGGFTVTLKTSGQGIRLTQTGTAVGTPSYMAPEYWRGDAVDARADVYALGIVLFEMLDGRLPFESDAQVYGLMLKHINEPPPLDRLSSTGRPPGITDAVVRVVGKALDKDPKARYETAGALIEALMDAAQLANRPLPRPESLRATQRLQPDTRSLPDIQVPGLDVLGLIRETGLMRIYAAEERETGRKVSLQVLRRQVTNLAEPAMRFQRATQSQGRLNHPGVQPIYDSRMTTASSYSLGRYLDAGSVADRIRQTGPFSLDQIRYLLPRIASALDYMHAQGIVHRTISASDIGLDSEGHPYVVEFGVVWIDGTDPITDPSTATGVPAYMAPEQWRGETVDGRADLYGLAVTVYQALTGQPPFRGETPMAVMYQHLNEPVPSVGALIVLPPPMRSALDQVFVKALAKKKEDRYATAGEFAEAFLAATAGEKAKAGPVYLAGGKLRPGENFGSLDLSGLKSRNAWRELYLGDLTSLYDQPNYGLLYLLLPDHDYVPKGINLVRRRRLSEALDALEALTRKLGQIDHQNVLRMTGSNHRGLNWFRANLYHPLDPDRTLASRHFVKARTDANDSQIFAILRQIAEGLDYAHTRNIVHGNLNPGCIYLGGDKLQIGEFGLAEAVRRIAAAADLKIPNVDDERNLVYQAPEVYQGKSPDARSDVFSLGVIALELLGHDVRQPRTPITATPPKLNAVLTVLHAYDVRLYTEVSEAAAQVLSKAVAHDPGTRYSSAGAFAEAFIVAMDPHKTNAGVDYDRIAPPPPVWPQIGEALGDYRILEQIGEGGMARVYRANRPRPKRKGEHGRAPEVALKAIPVGSPKFEAGLAREIEIGRALEHEHILPIIDSGATERYHYLVSPLMARSLANRIRRDDPLGLTDAGDILTKIAGALDYAHDQGVIHRDLKPSNILLDDSGKPYLMDFGVAALADEAATGRPVGTQIYMSPELMAGRAIDRRSDVYTLGLVAFQMLTGRLPLDSDNPYGNVYAASEGRMPIRAQIAPEFGDEIAAVLEKATAPDPDARYATAGEFAAAFASLAEMQMPSFLSSALKSKVGNVGANVQQQVQQQTVQPPVPLRELAFEYDLDEPLPALSYQPAETYRGWLLVTNEPVNIEVFRRAQFSYYGLTIEEFEAGLSRFYQLTNVTRLVPLLDYGSPKDQPEVYYIVSPATNGDTLVGYYERAGLTPTRLAELVDELAEAITFVNRNDLRLVYPLRFEVSAEGNIADAFDLSNLLLKTNPEAIQLIPETYHLSVLIYSMLTGQADPRERWDKPVDFPRLRASLALHLADFPAPLADVILDGLTTDRFADAAALAAAFREAAEAVEVIEAESSSKIAAEPPESRPPADVIALYVGIETEEVWTVPLAYDVRFRLGAEPFPGGQIVTIPRAAGEITLALRARNLSLLGETRCTLVPGKPLARTVQGSASWPGEGEITAELYAGDQIFSPAQNWRIALVIDPKAVQPENPALPPPANAADETARTPDLTLRLYATAVDAAGERLRFYGVAYAPAIALDSQYLGYRDVPRAFVERLQARLAALAVGSPGPRLAGAALAEIGRSIWREILPPGMAWLYGQIGGGRVSSVLLLTDAYPWLPYELAVPEGAHAALGEAFALTRWVEGRGVARRSSFPLGKVAVVQDADIAAGLPEFVALRWGEEGDSDAQTMPPVASLSEALSPDHEAAGLHIVRAGGRLRGAAQSLMLRTETADWNAYILQQTALFSANSPLVGLATLRDAHGGEMLGPEMALSLIEAGAPGVIGTWWAVDPGDDRLFWSAFYEALQRQPLGEALHSARATLRRYSRNPASWLAYYAIGDPMAAGMPLIEGVGYFEIACLEAQGGDLRLKTGQPYTFHVTLRRKAPAQYEGRRCRLRPWREVHLDPKALRSLAYRLERGPHLIRRTPDLQTWEIALTPTETGVAALNVVCVTDDGAIFAVPDRTPYLTVKEGVIQPEAIFCPAVAEPSAVQVDLSDRAGYRVRNEVYPYDDPRSWRKDVRRLREDTVEALADLIRHLESARTMTLDAAAAAPVEKLSKLSGRIAASMENLMKHRWWVGLPPQSHIAIVDPDMTYIWEAAAPGADRRPWGTTFSIGHLPTPPPAATPSYALRGVLLASRAAPAQIAEVTPYLRAERLNLPGVYTSAVGRFVAFYKARRQPDLLHLAPLATQAGGLRFDLDGDILDGDTDTPLDFDGDFLRRPIDVSRKLYLTGHPLIFLGAVHASAADEPVELIDYAHKFIEMGAGAVISPICAMPDALAGLFARHFYETLAGADGRQTLGQVLAATRAHLLQAHHNPLGLAYLLFGDPEIRVKASRP